MNLPLSPERIEWLKRVGLRVGFGVAVFIIAFYLSFPYDRIKEQVIAVASMRNLDVEIGSAGPAFGVGISFDDISVATRPPNGKPTRFLVNEATVKLSPMARLFGQDAVSVAAEALGGEIDLEWEGGKTTSRILLHAQDVSMALMPGVVEAINLPLSGKLGFDLDLRTAGKGMGETSGKVGWTCAACRVGDGKAKLKIAGNPLLAEGLGLPPVRLGDFTGKIVFDKGVGRLQAVQARSPDGELFIDGEIRLADPTPMSTLDLYVRFKLSEAMIKSADKLQLLLQIAESMGKRPDGYYGLRLSGSLGRMGPVQWSKTSPLVGAAGGRPPGPGSRPAARQPSPSLPVPPARNEPPSPAPTEASGAAEPPPPAEPAEPPAPQAPILATPPAP